jgi:hypothetical protein
VLEDLLTMATLTTIREAGSQTSGGLVHARSWDAEAASDEHRRRVVHPEAGDIDHRLRFWAAAAVALVVGVLLIPSVWPNAIQQFDPRYVEVPTGPTSSGSPMTRKVSTPLVEIPPYATRTDISAVMGVTRIYITYVTRAGSSFFGLEPTIGGNAMSITGQGSSAEVPPVGTIGLASGTTITWEVASDRDVTLTVNRADGTSLRFSGEDAEPTSDDYVNVITADEASELETRLLTAGTLRGRDQ